MKRKYVHKYDTFINRVSETIIPYNTKITRSSDIHEFVREYIYNDDKISIKEYFYVVSLNKANYIKGFQKIGEGGVDSCIADIRLVAKHALDVLASAIILIHNHPSNNLKPSIADTKLTTQIKEALELFNIKVLDHLILAPDGNYLSFADDDLL